MNEIIKRMNEIKARRLEIRGELEKRDASVDLDKLATELTDLETEYNGLEQRKRLLEGIADGSVPTNPVANPGANPAPANDQRAGQVSDLEERSAFIREITGATVENVEENARRFAQTEGAKTVIKVGAVKRSLTIASGGIAKPTKVSEIQPGENTVSGLLDMVLVVEAEGMAKDSVPYEKTGSTAAVGTDNPEMAYAAELGRHGSHRNRSHLWRSRDHSRARQYAFLRIEAHQESYTPQLSGARSKERSYRPSYKGR